MALAKRQKHDLSGRSWTSLAELVLAAVVVAFVFFGSGLGGSGGFQSGAFASFTSENDVELELELEPEDDTDDDDDDDDCGRSLGLTEASSLSIKPSPWWVTFHGGPRAGQPSTIFRPPIA